MNKYFSKSVFMEDLSWREIQAAIAAGYDTVLIGFGATEQHGPHLPISTDTITAKKLCELVALKRKNTLVAPLISIGSSIIHRHFPGTIDMEKSILFDYIKRFCLCLKGHGFKHIIIVPTHGGNFETAEKIGEFFAEDECDICCAYNGGEFINFLRSLSKELNISQRIAGTHSGEMETSIYMYLTNDLSVMEHVETGFCGDYDSVRNEAIKQGMSIISPSGIIGDAKQATYDKGQFYVNKLVDYILEKTLR